MRKTIKILIAWLCILALTTTALAHSGRTDSNGGHKDNRNKSGLGGYHYHCGGYPAHLHTDGYCPYTDIFPQKVSVKAEKTTLGIGETASIRAAVSPSNACNTDVSWNSSDPDVVRIHNGVIEAVGYGSATITAESFNGKVGSVTITVKQITAEKVSITDHRSSESVYIGDSWTLTAAITPENVEDPTLVWASSNEAVASVDARGNVRAASAGTAVITATASNGVAGKYTVTVNEKFVESVEIDADDRVSLLLGDGLSLNAAVTPADATYPELTWTTSDEAVALVSAEGHVTTTGCGSAVITAVSTNGLSDSITIEVNEIIAQRLEVAGESRVILGEGTDLEVVFYPADTTNQSVEWSVSDEAIASIDPDGHVRTLDVGSVTVTVRNKDVQTDFTLEVVPRLVEAITISSSAGDTMYPGDTATFTASVTPENATYPQITWISSNPEIAQIDSSGILEAKSIGTVTIIARAADGYEEAFELAVVMSPQSILAILGGGAAAGAGGFVWIRRKRRQHV